MPAVQRVCVLEQEKIVAVLAIPNAGTDHLTYGLYRVFHQNYGQYRVQYRGHGQPNDRRMTYIFTFLYPMGLPIQRIHNKHNLIDIMKNMPKTDIFPRLPVIKNFKESWHIPCIDFVGTQIIILFKFLAS